MTVIYKNDFKIRIPSGFSAQIIFDMLGEIEFIKFYEKYKLVKGYRNEQRRTKANPTVSSQTDAKMKEAFRKDPKYFGKVISKIKI